MEYPPAIQVESTLKGLIKNVITFFSMSQERASSLQSQESETEVQTHHDYDQQSTTFFIRLENDSPSFEDIKNEFSKVSSITRSGMILFKIILVRSTFRFFISF